MGIGKFSAGRRHDDSDERHQPLPEEQALTPGTEDVFLSEYLPEEEPAVPAEEPEAAPSDDSAPEDEDAWDDDSGEEPEVEEDAPKRSRTGTLIFYTLYILFILVFVGAVFLANHRLERWLTDYQLSQPTDKRDQVYAELFADPDWSAIYDAAQLEDTTYEGREAFAAYMAGKVGNAELELVETSTGLSGNRKYFLKVGQESLAAFLLEAEKDPITGLPRWELGQVEVFFRRNESIVIRIQEGQTAYVNGIPLDESHTSRIDMTLAKEYLPAGVHSHRSYEQNLSGLLIEPKITVLDESGQSVDVLYDETADLYYTENPDYPRSISESARKDVTAAAEAYSAYLLGQATADSLSGPFDRTSDIWQALMSIVPFDQTEEVYTLDEITIDDYRQYAEHLFSVRVGVRFLSSPIPAEDDKKEPAEEVEPKEHFGSNTVLFRYVDGRWVGIGLTGEETLPDASLVRITYLMDGVVISSYFYDTALRELVVPLVSAPEGRVFAGWYREKVESDGSITLERVFHPDATGRIVFPDDFTLEPMTLYALFEDAETETEVNE